MTPEEIRGINEHTLALKENTAAIKALTEVWGKLNKRANEIDAHPEAAQFVL